MKLASRVAFILEQTLLREGKILPVGRPGSRGIALGYSHVAQSSVGPSQAFRGRGRGRRSGTAALQDAQSLLGISNRLGVLLPLRVHIGDARVAMAEVFPAFGA